MWTCLTRLTEGLSLLSHYLDGLDKQDAILALNAEDCGEGRESIRRLHEHFRAKNHKTLFDYNTVIISLYGYFERFVEDLISEYLGLITVKTSAFADLPESIRQNHLPLSLELAKKADYQRYAGSLRLDEIISRLYSCLGNFASYKLNDQAFSQHTANFRHAVVISTLGQCGLSEISQGLRLAEPFIAFLYKEDQERDIETYLASGDEVVFGRVDDLANRRNDVAHGTPVDEILSRDILRSYLGFVEAYASALALVVYERSLAVLIKESLALGTPITVIDHRIVCVNLASGKVKVGDELIAATKDGRRPFKCGEIKEIQQNHVCVAEIEGGPGVQIGMRVEFHPKDNHEFYVLTRSS